MDELEQKLVREKNELLKLENDAKELAHTLLQKQMSYAKLEVVVQGKKEELVVAKVNMKVYRIKALNWMSLKVVKLIINLFYN